MAIAYSILDRYNAYMNGEASSYPWGSWITYEDMQITALRAAIASCMVDRDDYGQEIIYVDQLQELISQLEDQSENLKKNKQ